MLVPTAEQISIEATLSQIEVSEEEILADLLYPAASLGAAAADGEAR
jgi:hypothetical protein